MSLEVVPIHHHPKYLHDCCELINQEWKRSESARLHSLNQSKDNLPTSLILLSDKIVIGHVKLSIIPSNKRACFLESLVIEKNLRGRGHGSFLMEKAEAFCKGLGLTTIYLSTKDQEHFYSKLGYVECGPISIYGSFTDKFSDLFITKKTNESKTTVLQKFEDGPGPPQVPPPPPPPIPKSSVSLKKSGKTYMSKEL